MLAKPESCRNCIGWKWGVEGKGYVPASGTGENGVLIVAEAAGEHEAQEGMPLVGKAGYYLFSNLQRVGIEREGFKLHNVLSCRPPDNKLVKMWYEDEVVRNCAPFLDATIDEMQKKCKENGKIFTIVTLGRSSFRRIMGLDEKSPIMRGDYLCYPFRSEKYGAWVIAADHPSYLMRGNNHLVPVLQFAVKRALEIAEKGFSYHQPAYLRDPDPATFAQWIRDYHSFASSHPEANYLAFDIETPYKVGRDEEEVAREDDEDYTILRCSFAYERGRAVSVPWSSEYRAYLETLFKTPFPKVGWNSENYDLPRIRHQMEVRGDQIDAMLCWHVLNSALPKGLGFVAPFYAQDIPIWKHTANLDPSGYNAMDSDVTLRCFYGIRGDLLSNKQWGVFNHHVVELNRVLNYMSGMGVALDKKMRLESEEKLSTILDDVEKKMEEAVPQEARKFKVYKKEPKEKDGIQEGFQDFPITYCESCGLREPKKWKKHKELCGGADTTIAESIRVWIKPLEFKVSKVGLSKYQQVLKHHAILSRKERKITFDDSALQKLMKQYPSDKLYPLIQQHRKVQKLLSTYIGVTQLDGRIRGGMELGKDGRIHTTYTHNPSTLRLASQNPNLQNLPRGGDELSSIVRNLVCAGEGNIFLARDYSGIEAVLVGYFANSPDYIKLAKMDVHSFYTAYALNALDGRVSANDLPQLSWPEDKLRARLAEIKKEFKKDRNELYKHLVHGANFYQGPKGAADKIFAETGIQFPVKLVAQVMGIYFELFPDIKKWHSSIWLQAEKDGFVRNPFGYIHRFNKVFDYEKIGGRWQKKPGPEANKVVAFLPQSSAAGIIKEAMMRLFYDRFNEAGQYLRLQIHDEILMEVPEDRVEKVEAILKEEMERPISCMRMPESWGLGEYLTIDTEGKKGMRWGSMK